jgi:hypothetical protein
MKITKQQLKQIIKEELSLIFEDREAASEAHSDGWADYMDQSEDREKKWQNTKYLEDYYMGQNDARDHAEHQQFQDEEY